MVEALCHTTSRSLWCALESAYTHAPLERAHNLKDSLRQLKRGDSSVSKFGRKLKFVCDHLVAIGHLILNDDNSHWFLCGLGPAFESFSTAYRTIRSRPPYHDLLAQAEGQELVVHSLHGSSTPQVAFSASHQFPAASHNSSCGWGKSGRGGSNDYSGAHVGQGRRSPHCQLCRTDGLYANMCPQLPTYAKQSSYSIANLA
ncbi:uncharacterized protein LOC111901355 [Lactuca sativa]|uniref:uncharacterized protein LOC111901355 n=1 Tax=Lactuca sativa TaxID=4236 RepID=UPI000CD9548E|nr:uncharacterized protein LOC111901355 [Lactuca sativa]